MRSPIAVNQYGIVRILCATSVIYFFVLVLASRLVIPVAEVGSTFNYLPSFAIIGLSSSLLFLIGCFTRLSALGCLVCLNACLVSFSVLGEIQYPYLSLMLVIYFLFDESSFSSWRTSGFKNLLGAQREWYLPLFWVIFLGFSVLGIYKMSFAPWRNGEAILWLCPNGPIGTAWPSLCEWIPNKFFGYFVVLVEALSFPMAISRRTRPLTWFLNLALHLGAFKFVYARRVSYATVILLIFLFDPEWTRCLKSSILKIPSSRPDRQE